MFSFGSGANQQNQQQPQQQVLGFGSTQNNQQQPTISTGFGSSAFGQPSSAFGQPSTTASTSGAFGQQLPVSSLSTGGFGQAAAPLTSTFGGLGGGFGAGNTSQGQLNQQQIGSANAPTSNTVNNGTGNPAYSSTTEREGITPHTYNVISVMMNYRNWSFEELRLRDYELNKKVAKSAYGSGTSSTFGQTAPSTIGTSAFGSASNTGFGSTPSGISTGFGATSTPAATTGFGPSTFGSGSTGTMTSAFGQAAPSVSTGFGQGGTGFGTTGTSGFGGGGFGATSGFGQQQKQPTTSAFGGGGFGTSSTQQTGAFGQLSTTTGGFGQPAASTSAFGGTAAPAATTFGSGVSSSFGQQPTGGFGGGAFGTVGGTSGFGSNQPSTGGFGTGGMFGQKQPQTSTNAFGAPQSGTSLFGQPQQPSTSTPFGGSSAQTGFGTPASTGFGTAGSTGGFGTGAQASFGVGQPGTSLFGQQSAKPSGFGATPSISTGFGSGTAATPNTNLFGNQQQQTASSGGSSLFGGTATSQLGTGGMFGSQQQGAQGGLFGQPQQQQPSATSGGLFGQAPLKPATTSFSLGTTQPSTFGTGSAPATSLFGQPSTNNATAQSTQPSFSFGGSTTGATQAPATGGLFGSTFGGGSTFGQTQSSSLTGQQQQPSLSFSLGGKPGQQTLNQPGPSLTASIDVNAYGTTLALKPTDTSTGTTVATKVIEKKSVLLPQHRFFDTPRREKIRVRGTPFTHTKPAGTPFPKQAETKAIEDTGYSTDLFVPKRSVKKLDIAAATSRTSNGSGQESEFTFTGTTSSAPQLVSVRVSPEKKDRRVTFDDLPTPVRKIDFRGVQDSPSNPDDSILALKKYKESEANSSFSFSSFAEDSQTSSILPSDYYSNPSMNELLRMPKNQMKSMRFEVGRTAYGRVVWEKCDLSVFSDLRDLYGEVVKFDERVCIVYEDSKNKHPLGEGLNCPATIYLYNCFPTDKATRKTVKNRDGRNARLVDAFTDKLKRMESTHFLGYKVEDGLWWFKVDHFSRYGILDTEVDENEEETHLNTNTEIELEFVPSATPEFKFDLSQNSVSKLNASDAKRIGQMRRNMPFYQKKEITPRSNKKSVQRYEFTQAESSFIEPTTFKFQAPTTISPPKEAISPDSTARSPKIISQTIPSELETIPPRTPKKTESRDYKLAKNYILSKMKTVSTNYSADSKSPWGSPKREIDMKSSFDTDTYELCMKLFLAHSDISEKSASGIPTATLSRVTFEKFKFCFSESTSLSEKYMSRFWELASALFDKLPGESSNTEDSVIIQDVYIRNQIRKDLVNNWLQVLLREENNEYMEAKKNFLENDEILFRLLCSRNINDAVIFSLKNKNYYLANIISQLSDCSGVNLTYTGVGGLDLEIRDAIFQTLQNVPKDKTFNKWLLRIYLLLSSDLDAVFEALKKDNCNISWIQAFALYFWFWASSDNPLNDSFSAYEFDAAASESLSSPLSCVPPAVPWWNKDSSNTVEKDGFFHLFKLFSYDEYSIENILNHPECIFPPDVMRQEDRDKFSLFMYFFWKISEANQIGIKPNRQSEFDESSIFANTPKSSQKKDSSFAVLGQDSNCNLSNINSVLCISSELATQLTKNFIVELEKQGLWHYSVAVAMHITDTENRELEVQQLISSHVGYTLEEECLEEFKWTDMSEMFSKTPNRKPTKNEENFLINSLKISKRVVYMAKAEIAHKDQNYMIESALLLSAGEYEKAHEIIFQHLVSRAFTAQKDDFVAKLCSPLLSSPSAQLFRTHVGLFDDYLRFKSSFDRELGISILKRLQTWQLKRQHGNTDNLPSLNDPYFMYFFQP